MTHFHTNLKYLRTLKGRSQDVVATWLCVPRTTYSAWENGVSEPKLEKLAALGLYYRMNLDTLICTNLMLRRPSEVEQMQRDY